MTRTKRSLDPARLKLVEAIEELGWGRIEQSPLKAEFERLFNQLSQLHDGFVDVRSGMALLSNWS